MSENSVDKFTSRRSFLKSTSAVAGPVVLSETVRSESVGGKPLVIEVRAGYKLPNGLPDGDNLRPPLTATCSPPSYHISEDTLQVTPVASEEEVDTLEKEDKIIASDGISAFSSPIWGDNEKSLRLNPEIGVRKASELTLDDKVQSPEVKLRTQNDKVELKNPTAKATIKRQQVNRQQFSHNTVNLTFYRILDSEQAYDSTRSSREAPPKEEEQFKVEVIPEIYIKNHGRLAVEKLSIGDAIGRQ